MNGKQSAHKQPRAGSPSGGGTPGNGLQPTSPRSAALKIRATSAGLSNGPPAGGAPQRGRSLTPSNNRGTPRTTDDNKASGLRVRSSGYGNGGDYVPRPISPERVTNFCSEIPDHLRHREPFVPPMGDVEPRYTQPSQKGRGKVDPAAYYANIAAKKEHIPRNSQFGGVESRYRSPSPPKRTPPEDELVAKTASIKQTREYSTHKRHAAAIGMGTVPSKYVESAQRASSPEVTPRSVVEKTIAQIHRDINKNTGNKPFSFRRTPVKTFDEHKKFNKELAKWDSPTRKSSQRPSVVMQYIAGDVTLGPEPRSASPDLEPRMDGQIYVGGSTIKTKILRKAGQLENAKVGELVEKLKVAKAPNRERAMQLATPKVTTPKVVAFGGAPKPGSARTVVTTVKKGTVSKPRAEQTMSQVQPSTSRSQLRSESQGAKSHDDEEDNREHPTIVNFNEDGDAVSPEPTTRANNYSRQNSKNSESGRSGAGRTKAPLVFKTTEAPRL